MTNINHRLEQLIDRISIKKTKKKYIKGQTKYLTRHLKAVSQNPLQIFFNSYHPPLDYTFIQFNYGGSFDRHVCMRKEYDVDAYLVYAEKENLWRPVYINQIQGGHLFEMLRNHLESFVNNYESSIILLEKILERTL